MLARKLILILALAVAVLLVGGCQMSAQDRSLERVQEAGRLVIGVDPSYPPFEALDERGHPVGYEIDLASEIARRLGVAPHFMAIDVGGIVDALLARKVDVVIAGLPPQPEYGKQLLYSHPYFNAGQVLVTAPDGPPDLGALAGRTVGVESGSTGDLEMRGRAEKIADLRIKSYTTAQAALDDLRQGALDAVVTDVVTAREYLREHAGPIVAGPPFTDEFYVVAARRTDGLLAKEIDKTVVELQDEGYLERLQAKWLP